MIKIFEPIDKEKQPYDYDYIMDKMAKEELSIEEVEEFARQNKIDLKSMIMLQFDGPFHASPYSGGVCNDPVDITKEFYEDLRKQKAIFKEMEEKRQAKKSR